MDFIPAANLVSETHLHSEGTALPACDRVPGRLGRACGPACVTSEPRLCCSRDCTPCTGTAFGCRESSYGSSGGRYK